MRFERRGGPPDLQAAMEKLVQRLGGRALDDHRDKEAAEGRFPDFACFRDLVLIEMKHLEADQHSRINDVITSKIAADEMPVFYGARESHLIIDAASNSAEINAAIANKLNRTVEGILSSANKQLKDYRSRHPRKNSVNICLILNSKRPEYSPQVVAHAIHGKMKTSQPKEPRFPEIDSVLYISEKHLQLLPDGRPASAVLIYEGLGLLEHEWKRQFIDHIANAWSDMRSGTPTIEGENPQNFSAINDIPASMKRYESWILEYQRDPYLQTLPVEQLRVMFHRTVAVNSLTFLKGSWPEPPKEEVAQGLRIFQHIIEETNRRGIDLRLFSKDLLTDEDKAKVYVGLPAELVYLLNHKE